jgi:formate-dependent nitrite reductase membrane component NrfD
VTQAAAGKQWAPSPDGEVRSYHGRPVVKEPAWTWEVPWYLFAGGLAGASSALAAAARAAGNEPLARGASVAALPATVASPALLVSDLGVPSRFLNMLRVFKPTSPMSMGAWLLAAYGPAAGTAGAAELAGVLPRLRQALGAVAGALGPLLATYTGALVADNAVPVWHDARHELPFAFAGGAAASAGAAATLLTPAAHAAPARRLAVAGVAVEGLAMQVMQRRLGALGDVYHEGRAGRFATAAQALTVGGAALVGLAGRRRWAAVAGAGMVLAGAACERWTVYEAGVQSARDPKHTVGPQRRRADEAAAAHG